jgi:hypothetical protein
MLQRYNFYLSFAKKWAKNLQDSKNTLTFAADFKKIVCEIRLRLGKSKLSASGSY